MKGWVGLNNGDYMVIYARGGDLIEIERLSLFEILLYEGASQSANMFHSFLHYSQPTTTTITSFSLLQTPSWFLHFPLKSDHFLLFSLSLKNPSNSVIGKSGLIPFED
jgi:hypothetical protein